MKNAPLLIIFFLVIATGLLLNNCKHDPVYPEDTGENGNGNGNIDTINCDTTNVSYNGSVVPIFEQYCISCHSGATPQGGLDLTNFEQVAFVAQSGQLIGSISHLAGYSPMPKDGNKLSDCEIRTIEIWINDTTFNNSGSGHPCDPDTIYFERDLLPILQSACAQPGCHDAITQQDGVRLTDYASVMATGKIEPGDPDDSELYEVIIDPDPDKRMPPPPNSALPSEQIAAIRKWIEQGAQNLFCDDEECDTTNITYTNTVEPIIAMHCLGCHNDANPLGGLSLQGYDKVATIANDGRLMGTISHEPGYPAMPKNGMKLSDCKILQIETWIDNGLPN
jgi:mono/diheme cytochrome c family protein